MNHVKAIHEDDKSWCGEILKPTETYFKTLDQAVLNGMHNNGTFACVECIHKIVARLYVSSGKYLVIDPDIRTIPQLEDEIANGK